MSKVSGFSKMSSSRLAEMWKKTTFWSSSMCWPRISTGPVVWRRKFMTGVTKRSISSVARRQQRAVGEQSLPLVGVLEEGVHRPRDQVPRRLVAGHGEEQEEQLELELRELVAVDLDVGEHAHEVVGGVGLLLGEELGRVGEELDGRLAGVVLAVGVGLELGVFLADHPVGPVEHVVTVGLGYAEEIGDDLERELGGDVGDEVGLALLDDGVDDRRRPSCGSSPRAEFTMRGVKPLFTSRR